MVKAHIAKNLALEVANFAFSGTSPPRYQRLIKSSQPFYYHYTPKEGIDILVIDEQKLEASVMFYSYDKYQIQHGIDLTKDKHLLEGDAVVELLQNYLKR